MGTIGEAIVETIVIASLIGAFFGFLIMVAAVAVGTIIAHNHIERRAYKEQNRLERLSNRPSEVRARREVQQVQAPQTPVTPAVNTQPPQWQ